MSIDRLFPDALAQFIVNAVPTTTVPGAPSPPQLCPSLQATSAILKLYVPAATVVVSSRILSLPATGDSLLAEGGGFAQLSLMVPRRNMSTSNGGSTFCAAPVAVLLAACAAEAVKLSVAENFTDSAGVPKLIVAVLPLLTTHAPLFVATPPRKRA